MKQLILVSHGNLCIELKRTAEMIMGPQERIHSIPLNEHEGEETFYERFKELSENLDEYVVFSDLLGGVPCNTLSKKIMEGQPIELYTGMNLPMVLSFLTGEFTEIQTNYVQEAIESIVNVNEWLTSSWFGEENTDKKGS